MSVKIDIDPRRIEARIQGAIDTGLPILTDAIRKDCDYYVKVDQGTMRDSAATASDFDAGKIVYNTKYARRQYYTMRALRPPGGNPHASRRWFWMAKRRFLPRWIEQAQAIMEKGLSGHV